MDIMSIAMASYLAFGQPIAGKGNAEAIVRYGGLQAIHADGVTTLRIAETDRLLAKQGLTREEIGKMRFTTEQRELVNEELRRRGLEPIADWDEESEAVHEQLAAQSGVVMRDEPEGDVDGRRRKFGVFMQGIRL